MKRTPSPTPGSPMKLWLVKTDHYGYDEYDAFVIRAETAEEALHEAQWENKESVTVTEIAAEGETEMILGSFNAG